MTRGESERITATPVPAADASHGPDLAELLRATSRTFALGIELLREPLRREITVAYLVLRVSDYIEDNRTMSPERKVELLGTWHAALNGELPVGELEPALRDVDDPMPDAGAARNVAAVHRALMDVSPPAREVIIRHAGDSTLGMARWVERGPRFEVEEDLDDYMHEVAGRVGFLLTELFARHCSRVRAHKDEMMHLGREFGLGLQTVNVIRGLHEDRDRGWVFVPRAFIPDPEVGPQDLFTPERQAVALGVLSRLAEKADRHLDGARAYVRGIHRRHHRIRLFCLLPLFFAVRTLARSRSNSAVFSNEVKISRAEVRSIVRNTALFGLSNGWIDWYGRRLGRMGL